MSDTPTFHAGEPEADRPAPSNNLDDLLGELAVELEHEKAFDVVSRPGWAIVVDLNIDHNMLGIWRKKAADKAQPEGLDEPKWAKSIIAAQTTRILRHGAPVEFDGEQVTFLSPAFWQVLSDVPPRGKIERPYEAISRLYGRDAHIITTAYAILDAAGYGDRPAEADTDPTNGS